MNYFTIPFIVVTTVLSTIIPGQPVLETLRPTRIPVTFAAGVSNLITQCPTVPASLIVDSVQMPSPLDLLVYTAPVGLYAWQSAPPAVHEWGYTLVDSTSHRMSSLATSVAWTWSANLHAHTLVLCADGSLARSNSTVWCNGVGATSGRHRPRVAVKYIGPPPILTLPASPVLLALPAPPRLLTLPAPPQPLASPRSSHLTVLDILPTALTTQMCDTFPVPASIVASLLSTLDVPVDQLYRSARGVCLVLWQLVTEIERQWVVAAAGCLFGLMWAISSVTRGSHNLIDTGYGEEEDERLEAEETPDAFDGLELEVFERSGTGLLKGLAPDLFYLHGRLETRTMLDDDRTGATQTTTEETLPAALYELAVPEDAQHPSDDVQNVSNHPEDPFGNLELEIADTSRRGVLGGLAPDLFKFCDLPRLLETSSGTDSKELEDPRVSDEPSPAGDEPVITREPKTSESTTPSNDPTDKETSELLDFICTLDSSLGEPEKIDSPTGHHDTSIGFVDQAPDSQAEEPPKDTSDISCEPLDTVKCEAANEPSVGSEESQLQPSFNLPTDPDQGASVVSGSQECSHLPGASSELDEVSSTRAVVEPEATLQKTAAPRVSGAARLFAHALGAPSSKRTAEPSTQHGDQQAGGSDGGSIGGGRAGTVAGSRASMWASIPAPSSTTAPVTESRSQGGGSGGVAGEGGSWESTSGENRDGESGGVDGTRRGRRGRRLKKSEHFFALRHRAKEKQDPDA